MKYFSGISTNVGFGKLSGGCSLVGDPGGSGGVFGLRETVYLQMNKTNYQLID